MFFVILDQWIWSILIQLYYFSIYYVYVNSFKDLFFTYFLLCFSTDILKCILTFTRMILHCQLSCFSHKWYLTLSACLQLHGLFSSLCLLHGDINVCLWIFLCRNIVLLMTLYLFDANVTSILPFLFDSLCRLSFLTVWIYIVYLSIFALKSSIIIFGF